MLFFGINKSFPKKISVIFFFIKTSQLNRSPRRGYSCFHAPTLKGENTPSPSKTPSCSDSSWPDSSSARTRDPFRQLRPSSTFPTSPSPITSSSSSRDKLLSPKDTAAPFISALCRKTRLTEAEESCGFSWDIYRMRNRALSSKYRG